MSGTGGPTPAEPLDASGLRLGIAAACWHPAVAESLLERALAAAAKAGVAEPTVVRVPGSMELPLLCQELAAEHDAVLALGVVIRGDTPHFHYVCEATVAGLGRVALDTGTPVGNGVLTCETIEQAVDRSGAPGSSEDKGADSCLAALQTALALRALRSRR